MSGPLFHMPTVGICVAYAHGWHIHTACVCKHAHECACTHISHSCTAATVTTHTLSLPFFAWHPRLDLCVRPHVCACLCLCLCLCACVCKRARACISALPNRNHRPRAPRHAGARRQKAAPQGPRGSDCAVLHSKCRCLRSERPPAQSKRVSIATFPVKKTRRTAPLASSQCEAPEHVDAQTLTRAALRAAGQRRGTRCKPCSIQHGASACALHVQPNSVTRGRKHSLQGVKPRRRRARAAGSAGKLRGSRPSVSRP